MVHVFLIQLIPQELDRLSKALEMDDFSLPQEFDCVVHIRVIAEPKNVVIGRSGLLFWRSGILATIIHRNIGNKRLISIKYEQFLVYTFL